jgi:regulator of sigma E protease
LIDLLGSGLLSVVAFVSVMSFVVVFHELGHYWAGRRFGVHAEAFSIGFGPQIFGWTDKNGTLWKISALPLGGFVRFRGDENAASAPDREALENLRNSTEDADTVLPFKPLWQRSIIVAAGPIANFVLAIILFSILGIAGGERRVEPRIGVVIGGSPAEGAGFQEDDLVVSIDGREVNDFNFMRQYVATRAGAAIEFGVQRGGAGNGFLTLTVVPETRKLPDGLGGERSFGFLGVIASDNAQREIRRVNALSAPIYGTRQTWATITLIGDYLSRLVTGRASFEHINGPLGIATTAGQLANTAIGQPENAAQQTDFSQRLSRLGLSMLALSALLSVGLGVMNLLPIPMLDGGHLAFYAYEAIFGRPASPAVQETGFRIGLAAVLCMLVVATWNDLSYLRGLFS